MSASSAVASTAPAHWYYGGQGAAAAASAAATAPGSAAPEAVPTVYFSLSGQPPPAAQPQLQPRVEPRYTPGSKKIVWPTPDQRFANGAAMIDIVQPTASGRPISGLFGCVRNDGARFHEGIDLGPVRRDRRGHALDKVYAVMDGTVSHINRASGNSGYGLYIVLEHQQEDVAVYTLYSHMASIPSSLHVGQQVKVGEELGVMGNTAGGYRIPLSQSHVHFEIGLRLSDNFDNWYRGQKFGSPNHHGNYNGMNMTGMDPTDFWEVVRQGRLQNFESYIKSLPVAFTLRIKTDRVPDFIRRYPRLLTAPLQGAVAGWQIDFTWYGLPTRWTPLPASAFAAGARESEITLVSFDPDQFEGRCRNTLIYSANGTARLGNAANADLRKLFGF